jgi:uncharacterized protein involved in exopolysaccharide biosynthesis
MSDFPLTAIAAALWRARGVIVASAVVLGLVGLVVARMQRPQYEAQVTLIIADSKMRDSGNAANPAGFIALLANRAMARQIVDEFDLGAAPHGLTPTEFLDRVRVEDVRNATLIRIRVRLSDAELATKVANRFAELAVALNRTLNQNDTTVARDLIKSQLDEAQKRLETARAAMLALRREARVELSKADVTALVEQREQGDGLLVSLAAERARLAQLERDLVAQPTTLDSSRSAAADADLVAAINERSRDASPRPSGGGGARSTPTESTTSAEARREDEERRRQRAEAARLDETVPALPGADSRANPVRLLLEYQVAAARAKVAGLEQQVKALTDVLRPGSRRTADLERLYTGEEDLKRRELDVRVAEAAYSDLAVRYEQARLQVAGRSAELQVVDPAVVPTSPVAWGLTVQGLVGALAGLVFAAGFVSVRALMRTWVPA